MPPQSGRTRLRVPLKTGVALIAVALGIGAAIFLSRINLQARVGSGYMAQTLCSGIFVSEHSLDVAMATGLTSAQREQLRPFTPTVDKDETEVRVALHVFALDVFALDGVARQTALFREGFGCTLIENKTAAAAALRAETAGLLPPPSPENAQGEWPEGPRVAAGPWSEGVLWPDSVDGQAAERAVDAVFAEPFADRPRGSRALVVVHRGRIVAERYAPGFNAQTPFIGWSMSKTAINALVGLRVKDGAVALDDSRLMPEWRDAGDPRGAITLNELMRMTSGLAFDEDTNNQLSDVARMLFLSGNTARFAASKPLDYEPGTHWSYSSGTTEIISAVLRETFQHERDYWRYPRERLFAPLGMRTAVFALDASGTFVGSAFLYASARDWARLGLLYLQDGEWRGQPLLPDGWIEYTTTPTQQSEDGKFGAHVWLRLSRSPNGGEPPMPEDAYYMQGLNAQVVVIVPSRELVIVRLGLTPPGGSWNTARELAPLVNAFPERTR